MTRTKRFFGLTLLFGFILLTSAFLTLPSSVSAANCDKNETIFIECGDGQSGVWSLLLIVINVLTTGIGIVAVGGIVYGAILWTTAEDKAGQITKAQGVITNVVIGLITYAFIFAGLQFLVPGGVFNRTYGFSSVTNTTTDTLEFPADDDSGGSGGGDDSESGEGNSDSGDVNVNDIQLNNLRDASRTSGTILKKKVLYRSAQLSKLTPANSDKLSKLLGSGATIIDLRTARQRSSVPDKPVDGASNTNIPIEGILDQAPMVSDPTRRAQMSSALKLAANANGNVLVHCVAGKDRTGWFVAMIMYANGATDAQVMKEYLKSNQDIQGGVKAEWLNNGLQAARSQYGTIPNYLKSGLGLSTSDIAKLKSKFGA